jgi:predicted  nucleic acid-binding Zn-ribbon protein
MNHEKTILEAFREREKEIKKECDRLDAEYGKKRLEQERVQADALGKLEAARGALATMKADYHALKSELEGKAKAELEATEITEQKVKEGKATVRELWASGLSNNALEQKARNEVQEKLTAVVKIIRAKGAEIFDLNVMEAQARKECIFATTFPGQTQVKKLEAELEVLRRGIGEVFGGYYLADVDIERAKADARLCSGRSIDSVTWDDIGYDELCDLRLDPRITNTEHFKALDGLEEIITAAKPGKRYSLTMSHANGMGREAGFIVRALDEDRGMITTSTTAAPAKK